MDPKQLTNYIIDSAEATEGTWTVQFLNEIAGYCRRLSAKQVDIFVHLLMNDEKWYSMENSSKLKIGQLLVSLRSFFYPSIGNSITKEKTAISRCVTGVQDGKIADATKKVLNSLLTPASGQVQRPLPRMPGQRIHSMSVQPKERSIPITPPPAESNQPGENKPAQRENTIKMFNFL